MYAITRRFDVLAPVLIDCNCRERGKGAYYGDSLGVVDCRAASIVDTRTVGGSTVRVYNAAGPVFVALKSGIVSTQS